MWRSTRAERELLTRPRGLEGIVQSLLRRARPAAAAAPAALPPRALRLLDDAELRERYGLTDRQVAVARLVAEGCTNAEIARRLGLSFYTARNHAEQVMFRMGVSNRSSVGPLLFDPA